MSLASSIGSTEFTSVEMTAASKLHMAPKHFNSSSRNGTLCSCKNNLLYQMMLQMRAYSKAET